ncbi:Uncharacterised protein [Bacillus freudenreichii]|nr:Uncharacterised protein [Bacillus freudenreichii]
MNFAVALLVSAWIEIILKSFNFEIFSVALLVSAWIEIELERQETYIVDVALLVSAWIEIGDLCGKRHSRFSRTPCECVD